MYRQSMSSHADPPAQVDPAWMDGKTLLELQVSADEVEIEYVAFVHGSSVVCLPSDAGGIALVAAKDDLGWEDILFVRRASDEDEGISALHKAFDKYVAQGGYVDTAGLRDR